MKIIHFFRSIFDFIIPLMPERLRSYDTKTIASDDIKGEKEVLAKKAEAAQQCYNEERSRAKTIEGKASIFITSSGFLGTILIGTSNILISQKDDVVWFKLIMILCLLLFAIYMVGTIINSLKALNRAKYFYPDASTVMNIAEKDDFDKQVIADFVNSTVLNQDIINQKMDYVVVAQRYFKRLMISVLVFVVTLLIYILQQNGLSLLDWFSEINEKVSNWSFQLWYLIITSVLLVVSLVIGIVSLVKIKKKLTKNNTNS